MTYTHRGFDWDDAKNVANQEKHGVSFEDARELFTSGAPYLELFDHVHSDDEERLIAIGPTAHGLLVVVWTEREDDVLRLISARLATKRERQMYVEQMEQAP